MENCKQNVPSPHPGSHVFQLVRLNTLVLFVSSHDHMSQSRNPIHSRRTIVDTGWYYKFQSPSHHRANIQQLYQYHHRSIRVFEYVLMAL